MILVTTVCNVYDDPAILLRVDPSALLMGVKVKGVESGKILELGGLLRPGIIDGKPYLGLPGFKIGELVACRIDAVDADDLDRWFDDDHEVSLRDYVQERVACLTTPDDLQEPPQEAPTSHEDTEESSEDVQEPEAPGEDAEELRGGVLGCPVSELRTVLIEVMRRQDRVMTVREIAAILNSDNTESRTRIASVLADMEGKGLVKRGGTVPSSSPGRKTATTWVIA